MTAEVALPPGLSRLQARSLTDEVKTDAETLWRKLVDLYEGGAHKALGYSSWASYFQEEFGGSRSRAYQILDAGRVARHLQSTKVDSPVPTERHARELRPLLSQPAKLVEAWDEATESTDSPTASAVREIVFHKVAPMNRKAVINANAATRKLHSALASIDGYRAALVDFPLERALTLATADDIETWDQILAEAVAVLNLVRKTIKESKR